MMDASPRASRKFFSRMPVLFYAAAGVVFLGYSIWRLRIFLETGDEPLLVVYFALFGAWLVAMLSARSRPILEITQEEIRYGSAIWASRRSVRIEEVVEVGDPSGFRSAVRVRLRSGHEVRVSLGEIRDVERAEALKSIRVAIAAARAGEPS